MAKWRLTKPLRPLRIGLDLDGVLALFDQPALDKMRLIQPEGISDVVFDDIEQPDRWGWTGHHGITRETNREFWKQVNGRDAEFWYRLRPTACVTDELRTYLRSPDVHPYYITSRPFGALKWTQQWLDQHDLPGTMLLAKAGTKGHLAHALGLHGMIDDKPENLTDVLSQCKLSCVPILLDKPWNKTTEHPYLLRVGTVKEGLALLEQAAQDERDSRIDIAR